jgi:hypothetical protein
MQNNYLPALPSENNKALSLQTVEMKEQRFMNRMIKRAIKKSKAHMFMHDGRICCIVSY